MLENIKNIALKCKRYGIQKVLISGLLTTNCLAQDVIEEVNKLIKNMCNIEGYCYVNYDNIIRANIFKYGLHLLDTGKQILADNFVFNVNRNVSHISSKYALDSSLEKIIYFDSNEDKLPDLEKLRDARLRYLKQPLFAYLNINSLRNKVIDLKEIVGYLSPDYLVLSETKLDDSFPSAQFNLPN